MRFKTLLITFALLLCYSATLASAQSPTATDSATIIKDKIREKVDEELNAIKKAIAKRSYVGTISSISDLTVSIKSLTDATKTITIATDSTIKLASGKEGTIKDLKVNNFIIAMGDADSNGVLTAKRVVVTSKSPTDTRKTIYGTVTKTSATQLNLTTPAKTEIIIKTTSETKFSTQSKITSLKQIAIGDQVVAVTKPSTVNDTTFTATRIFALSTTASPTPTKAQ
jgi:hypothetical protein